MLGLALFLTDFADAGVMAPVAAAVALTLIAFRQLQAAIIWLVMIAAVWALMLTLKFGGYLCADLGCALPPPTLHLVSPSGHVAASAAIYGGLLGLSLRSAGRSRLLSGLAALAVAALIGATRLVLYEHSLAEVVVGAGVGVTAAMLFLRAAPVRPSAWRGAALLAAAAVPMALFHGRHLNFEPEIRAAAQSLAAAR